uniref:CUB domain-containing protein n=1 Tax=Branchiostoma floridae TaxID=7739 RepID=C3YCR3_BRAFL|eukprot:XP_002605854.1 hypothetical protein BRAFLDRAFT_90827 [Branchiostoma floridae]
MSLTADSGSFTSPNYTNNYPDNSNCTYKISVTPPKVIRLTFTDFNTEEDYDFVYVYDGDTVDPSQLIGKFHGASLPDPRTSSGSVMTVRFTSDEYETRKGFQANYAAEDKVFARCGVGQYRCANGVTCIDAWRRCDGNNDCRDRSDEDASSCACQDIPSSLTICRGLEWGSKMTLPNPLDYSHTTLDMVTNSAAFTDLESLAESDCHPRVRELVCATIVPRCEASPNLRQKLPCRSWCEEVKYSCNNEDSWEAFPNCEIFPYTNCNNIKTSMKDGVECFDGNGANYRGDESRAPIAGVDCSAWSDEQGIIAYYPWANLVGNKCRNPDDWNRPWCYKPDGYEDCDIVPCNIKGCKDPGKPQFGQRSPKLKFYWPDDTITYTCDTGYKFKKDTTPNRALCVTDDETGEVDWETDKPECEVDQKFQLQKDLLSANVYNKAVSPTTSLNIKAYVVNVINLDNMTCAVCWRAGEEYTIDCSNSTTHKDSNFLTCQNYEADIVTGEWSGKTTLSARNNTACLTMTLKRDPTYHYSTTISPCLILIILMIITFIMPIDKGDRIGFGVTVLLSMVVSLVVVTGFLPVSSTLPFIAMLIIVCMALMALFMLTTLFIIIIHDKKGPVPKWARTIFLKHIARALLMGDLTKKLKKEDPAKYANDIERHTKAGGQDPAIGGANPPLNVKNEVGATLIGLKGSVDELKASVEQLSGSIDAMASGGDDDEEVGEYALLAKVLDRLSLVLYIVAIAVAIPCTLLIGRPKITPS